MISVDIRQKLGSFKLDARFESSVPVVALFGRSGSGKTSIINAIAGVTRPDQGHIRLDETELFNSRTGVCLPAQDRHVGYVFQDGLLFPHMSVEGNLQYGARRRGGLQQTTDVIELLGLAPLMNRKPAALSGGEKQRVAIGRALLSRPRLLLLDEPLASLDSARKGEILTYIESLRDELHIPIVIVSHALDEVVRVADTMALVDDGRITACGDVDDIMSRLDLAPQTGRYEAGAVIETLVAGHDIQYNLTRLSFPGGELIVPRMTAPVGERARVRIRARDVSLATVRPQAISINNVIGGVVAEIREEAGAIVDVRVAVGESNLIARLTRQSVERLALRPGLPVFALVKAISLDRRSVGYA